MYIFIHKSVDNVEKAVKHDQHKKNNTQRFLCKRKMFFVDNVEKLVNNLYSMVEIVDSFVDNVTN
ncbi:hypothetical protein DI44_17160 [Geobacillus sp. CAMR5420]|nr:hypothetical protein A0V43_16705 [Geobacillus sp. JS12]EPR28755.1 hypothetical protein I656_01610 [Geobacillus sp. WSUCF1]KDE50440.1 hypothetical protein DI44_17160 [Geobacillus sp. CAMR5420]OQP13052.1 hypothetical protein B1693_17045 [Geobacillus zalihae]OQP22255.1 hypothetical protein B1694_10625 [Geobacillus zalihae]